MPDILLANAEAVLSSLMRQAEIIAAAMAEKRASGCKHGDNSPYPTCFECSQLDKLQPRRMAV